MELRGRDKLDQKILGISVVVPHYGDPAHALNLVDLLRQQIDAPVLEIIVVDDCSPQAFPVSEGVILTRRDVNGGFGTAVNTGAQLGTQDYLLVLNSDLEPTPTFIKELVEAAQPLQPAVVSPALFNEQNEYQWAGRIYPTNYQYFIGWLTVLARFKSTMWWQRAVGHDTNCVPGVIHSTDWVVGAAMLIPMESFRQVGGFDESFYMYCEEIDVQRRMAQLGIKSYVAGTVPIVHVGGKSTDPSKGLRWMLQSRLKFAQKWRENPGGFRLVLMLATCINFLWNCQRKIRGVDVRPIKIFRRDMHMIWK